MKYLVKYSDNAKDIDYSETTEYDGQVEDLLKELCEKHEARYQNLMKGLSEKDPEHFRYSGRKAYRFKIDGNIARINTLEDDINVLVITADPCK